MAIYGESYLKWPPQSAECLPPLLERGALGHVILRNLQNSAFIVSGPGLTGRWHRE